MGQLRFRDYVLTNSFIFIYQNSQWLFIKYNQRSINQQLNDMVNRVICQVASLLSNTVNGCQKQGWYIQYSGMVLCLECCASPVNNKLHVMKVNERHTLDMSKYTMYMQCEIITTSFTKSEPLILPMLDVGKTTIILGSDIIERKGSYRRIWTRLRNSFVWWRVLNCTSFHCQNVLAKTF